jgi:hypothetical protein
LVQTWEEAFAGVGIIFLVRVFLCNGVPALSRIPLALIYKKKEMLSHTISSELFSLVYNVIAVRKEMKHRDAS